MSGQKTKHDLTTAENACRHCGNFFFCRKCVSVCVCVFLKLAITCELSGSACVYFGVKAHYTLTH